MMMSSTARVKFTKTKVILRYPNKGVSNKFIKFGSNSKVIHVQISVPKWEKRNSGKKFCGLQHEAIRGLQIGARGITNRASFRDFKSGQKDYKLR